MPPQPVRHRLGPPVRAPEAAALLRTLSAASLGVSGSPPIFDAPRAFLRANESHATIRLTCCRTAGRRLKRLCGRRGSGHQPRLVT